MVLFKANEEKSATAAGVVMTAMARMVSRRGSCSYCTVVPGGCIVCWVGCSGRSTPALVEGLGERHQCLESSLPACEAHIIHGPLLTDGNATTPLACAMITRSS